MNTTNNIKKIYAVIVLYGADIYDVRTLLQTLEDQVDGVVFIDNSEIDNGADLISRNCLQVEYLCLKSNHGIAYAQNIGVEIAIKKGADFILFLDQDSCLYSGVSRAMVDYFEGLEEKHNVAAISGRYEDSKSRICSSFLIKSRFWYSRISPTKNSEFYSVQFLISSGMFVPVNIFKDVGFFNSDLFIDHVDTEWCIRALNKGYKLYGFGDLNMSHQIGISQSRIWFCGRRNVAIHDPVRNYYNIRNSMYIIKLLGNERMMYFLVYKLILYVSFMAIFQSPRYLRVNYMMRGFFDAFRGKFGVYK